MKKILILVVCVVVSVSVYARLRETREQCDKRYGKPERSEAGEVKDSKKVYYRKGAYQVVVYLYNGKVVCIKYMRPKKGDGNHKLEKFELEKFLSVNGKNWQRVKDNSPYASVYRRAWIIPGKKVGIYDEITGELLIQPIQSEYSNKLREQDKKSLEGF